jgi:hypothetical protein
MNLSRRSFLKAVAATGAALLLPPSLTDNAEAAKRFWALDSTMLGPEPDWGMFGPHNSGASFGQWVEAYERRDTPFADWMLGERDYAPVTIEVGQSYNPYISTKLRLE